MRSTLALSALALADAQAPYWGQNGGGRLRSGVWPAAWTSANVGSGAAGAEAAAAAAAAPAQLAEPGAVRVERRLGAAYPITVPSVRAHARQRAAAGWAAARAAM